MSKNIATAVLDLALAGIATSTRIDVTSDSSTPTDLTNTLANATLTAGDGNGSFTIANGSVSGRKVTVAQQSDKTVTASGTALHIVLSVGGTIKAVTTCTSQVLTSGNTVTIPSFAIEIQEPS